MERYPVSSSSYSVKHLSFWRPLAKSHASPCNKKGNCYLNELLEISKHGGAEKTSSTNRKLLAPVSTTGKSQSTVGAYVKMSTPTTKGSATVPTEFTPVEFTGVLPVEFTPVEIQVQTNSFRLLKKVVTAEEKAQQNLNRQKVTQFVEDAIVSNNPTMLRQAIVHVKENGVARLATVSPQRLQMYADYLEAVEFLRTAVACGSEDTSQCRDNLAQAVKGDTGRALKHLTETCDVKHRLRSVLTSGSVDDLFVVICECLIDLLQNELRIEHRSCQKLRVVELEKKAQRVKEFLAELIDNKMKSDEDAIVQRIWTPLVQKKLLLELKMPGGCQSLLDTIGNSRGPTWVDCSLWKGAPKHELPHVARILHARGGLLAWPSASVFTSLCTSGFAATEREQLWSDASHAALRVLRSAIDQTHDDVTQAGCVEMSLGKIVYLERIIQYAEEFSVAREEIESARRAVHEVKASVAAQKRARATKNVKKLAAMKNFLGLSFQSEHIQRNDASNALVGMGLSAEQADDFLSYADCEGKGFINFHDFTQLFERCAPAGPREMCRFVDFIQQHWGSYEAAFYAMAANIEKDVQISLAEFDATVNSAGWKDVAPRAIFVALDPMKKGYLDLDDLRAAALFEGIHILHLWQEVRDALLKRFGKLKKAFKALDTNKSGSLSYQEFLDAMTDLDITSARELKVEAFFFIDTDASGIMTASEVEVLQNFDATSFMRTLLSLRKELVLKYGDLQTAFEKIDTSQNGECSLDEFKYGCQKIKWSEFSDVAPGLLYHFLDRSSNHHLSKKEWMNLNYFNPPRAAADSEKHRLFLKNLFGTTDPRKAYIQFQAKVNEGTSVDALT